MKFSLGNIKIFVNHNFFTTKTTMLTVCTQLILILLVSYVKCIILYIPFGIHLYANTFWFSQPKKDEILHFIS